MSFFFVFFDIVMFFLLSGDIVIFLTIHSQSEIVVFSSGSVLFSLPHSTHPPSLHTHTGFENVISLFLGVDVVIFFLVLRLSFPRGLLNLLFSRSWVFSFFSGFEFCTTTNVLLRLFTFFPPVVESCWFWSSIVYVSESLLFGLSVDPRRRGGGCGTQCGGKGYR